MKKTWTFLPVRLKVSHEICLFCFYHAIHFCGVRLLFYLCIWFLPTVKKVNDKKVIEKTQSIIVFTISMSIYRVFYCFSFRKTVFLCVFRKLFYLCIRRDLMEWKVGAIANKNEISIQFHWHFLSKYNDNNAIHISILHCHCFFIQSLTCI